MPIVHEDILQISKEFMNITYDEKSIFLHLYLQRGVEPLLTQSLINNLICFQLI